MSIAFQNSTTGFSTSSNTFVINVPSGVANDDFLVMGYHCIQTTSSPTITGWTQAATISDGVQDNLTRIYWRRASSEPASYTVTLGATYGTQAAATILRYTGVIASGSPVRTTATAAPAALGSPKTGPNLTGVLAGDMTIQVAGVCLSSWNGNDFTLAGPGGSWVERGKYVNTAGTATPAIMALDQQGALTGPSMTATGTGAAGTAWRIAAMALIPEPESGFTGWGIPIK